MIQQTHIIMSYTILPCLILSTDLYVCPNEGPIHWERDLCKT